MSELALFLVRAAFVVILWIFIFTLISVVRSDLFGQKIVRKVVKAHKPQVLSSPVAPAAAVRASAITEPVAAVAGKGVAGRGSVGKGSATSDGATGVRVGAPERLLITAGDKAGYQLKLDHREITIGRAANSDLVIDDEFASTHHARLVKLDGQWMVQDLNSTNGTFLDGEKIHAPVALKLGAEVRIGKTAFELRG